MNLQHAVQLVVADQRHHRRRGIPALSAIKHVRGTYDHDNVDARWNEGSITHRPTAEAYHQIIDADGYKLSMLLAGWEPSRVHRPACSLWVALPVVVAVIAVLIALLT